MDTDVEVPLSGVESIAAERMRQIFAEAWTLEHDQQHGNGELIQAAACCVLARSSRDPQPVTWPWDEVWWKPSSDTARNLAKAGALIAAEIDRLNALDKLYGA